MSKFEVRDKNVLLTGASSGIGKELALLFARDGANLVIDSRPYNRAAIDSMASDLSKKFNINVWPFHIDLTDEKGPEKLYETAREAAGKIDALINDAGTFHYGSFSEIDYAQQELMVKTNVMAVFKLTRLAIPDMVEAREGRILNITSCSAFQPTVYHAAYGATKAFVQTLSEAIDAELKGTGVRVLTFSPPYTVTPLIKTAKLPDRMPWFSVSGLWDPAVIAGKCYQAFREGKTICIPGPMNWLVHSILIRLSPHNLINAVSLWALKSRK